MSALIALLCIVISLFVAHFLIHGTKSGKLFNKIPGPPLIPVIGNAFTFGFSPVALFNNGRRLSNTFKGLYRIWGIDKRIVNLYNPEDIEILLSNPKHITKSYLYTFLHTWLNDGLLTSSGQKWHQRRKILTPSFHFNILRQFCEVFREQSDKLIERLEAEVDNDETEILPYITDFALYSICETAMGTDLTTVTNVKGREYVRSIKDMSYYIVYRFSRLWLYTPFAFALTQVKKLQDETVKKLHSFTTSVIRERRKTIDFDDIKNQNSEDYTTTSKKRMAMLDLLLYSESKKEIDEKGIREEVDTFMFEGHDTTTMGITFALMVLANHEDIQERVYQEINEVFGDESDITIERLNKLQYLERCLKETLRLYPSVTMIGRFVTEDLQLKNYLIPAFTTYHVHIYDLHRRDDLYINPLKFDPDRFTPENCAKRHPYAYIPFSAGPRNCIGQKFAILEEKAVIVAILRKFKLKPITKPEDIIFQSDMVLKCRDPVKVKFLHRN